MDGIELPLGPILPDVAAGERRRGEDGRRDGPLFFVDGIGQTVDDARDCRVAIIPPGLVGRRVLDLEGIDAFFVLENLAADGAVAEIEGRILLVLDEIVFWLKGFGKDHVRIADIIQVNALNAVK